MRSRRCGGRERGFGTTETQRTQRKPVGLLVRSPGLLCASVSLWFNDPERQASRPDGLEALAGLGGAGELGLHLAELLALGLAPPDRPGDAQDADHADAVEQ